VVAAYAVDPAPVEVRPGVSRRRLMLAWTYDIATLLVAYTGAGLFAVAWMLMRTDRGRFDLGVADAVFAFALVAAVGPAWTAWQWLRLWDEGVTAGHARAGLRPSSTVRSSSQRQSGARRAVWLTLHPASLPLWAWTTATLFATGGSLFIVVAAVPLVVTMLVGLLALGSLV
jgi:hypothetical protein